MYIIHLIESLFIHRFWVAVGRHCQVQCMLSGQDEDGGEVPSRLQLWYSSGQGLREHEGWPVLLGGQDGLARLWHRHGEILYFNRILKNYIILQRFMKRCNPRQFFNACLSYIIEMCKHYNEILCVPNTTSIHVYTTRFELVYESISRKPLLLRYMDNFPLAKTAPFVVNCPIGIQGY